ncbi:hypothetical protein MM213_14160 [Belliella sp. R4-6]|uniref:Uncharacterized protein n=1 Tax=Belliella alkalica TaxID=1730871 RepID=A0ABS9VFC0_9BACT|nr:hypothetical protein [Belliella alkalica]MCH7414640.1 hypothetical protein [Belliella alkalica]
MNIRNVARWVRSSFVSCGHSSAENSIANSTTNRSSYNLLFGYLQEGG